jgi:hypothetical protein
VPHRRIARAALCAARHRLWPPSAVDRGREQPPCFCQAPVPDPVRGLLTPRLSAPFTAPRSHARSRSPHALNRQSERRSDRRRIPHSIRSLDERAADVRVSAVDIRGEQEGGTQWGNRATREVFPPLVHLAQFAAPPRRPMWSTFESAVSGHGSFPTSQATSWLSVRATFTSAKPMTESDCASVPGRAQIRPCNTSKSSRCHGHTPVRCRCVGSRTQCAHFQSGRTTTSTLRMGTRIMADRRRSRTRRGRRYWGRPRANDGGSTENGADASLRAFVRALARQAARECFEVELKQRSRTIQ